MTLYTSDGYAYEGMDTNTISALRTVLGLNTTFVDKATYSAYVASVTPIK